MARLPPLLSPSSPSSLCDCALLHGIAFAIVYLVGGGESEDVGEARSPLTITEYFGPTIAVAQLVAKLLAPLCSVFIYVALGGSERETNSRSHGLVVPAFSFFFFRFAVVGGSIGSSRWRLDRPEEKLV